MPKKIRVLVTDDSLVFREFLARGISADPAIEVVGTVADVYMARDKIIELEPDVLTLDVEMPKMNGIEFLRRLLPQYPIPVVMVSAKNDDVFEALQAGAVDFVCKPDTGSNERAIQAFINELIIKIKIASTARVKFSGTDVVYQPSASTAAGKSKHKLIAIGASTGGTEALNVILKNLPENMPGIVIVQHMPPVFTRMYAERLNQTSSLEVREARDGERIMPGLALIAPGDYHMTVCKAGDGYAVRCRRGEKINGHCPSVDALFNSVAEHCRAGAVGVILTGMGHDGAKGLLAMRKNGARTIGQDESSSIVYGMPKVAFDIGAVEQQASLERIPTLLCSITSGK
ncbi:MAG TPA: chemotaxis response regulator protein-glutamate methylesterase [Syntrophomonas sp.]|nr:chemotaxis response regulator protein-glutamate methylesterase [Syntrophomonas sp.]